MPGPEIVERFESHGDGPAVTAVDGALTYGELLEASHRAASSLLHGEEDLAEARVAFLVRPSLLYVATMLGTWRAGGMAVPVGTALPPPEIEYVLDDAAPSVVVADEVHAERIRPLAEARGIRYVPAGELLRHDAGPLPHIPETRASLMLYTSGTTGRPKGVVHTHASIAAQIRGMVEAWGWTAGDRILCTLPMHHTHGIVNVLGCALWSGARCDVMPAFDAQEVWRRIAEDDLTLFMAVPTIYLRLIQAHEEAGPKQQAAWSRAASRLRLMVSGSAALPVPTLERWRELTGHTLLERYGMTEIGMALSNTLTDRRPGRVGRPMPGVEVRLVDESGEPLPDGVAGEIQVRGPNLFREYWRRPEATRDAFDGDWFRTGDVAVVEDGSYRTLGRASVDIIKSGGEKISALEVEDVLRQHPDVVDCAVVAVPDDEWGERVCAAVVGRPGTEPSGSGLRDWAKQQLAAYKVPRQFVFVPELPRNAMGKVTKPELLSLFGAERG